eukprot:TRINITY_DN222_c0_g2_i1.p3 TRINITY_DN222_c0_g2~~TRINITY_DN222_c0_g2_i1.p3  ORF type:complete len:194 (+),score=24.05 TRINITY_DN222_c0_g2_i1:74-655(+)
MLSASFLKGQKVPVKSVSPTNSLRLPRVSHRAPRLVIRAGITDVGKYLSEAAQRIFSVQDSDVNWKQISSPYEGTFSMQDRDSLDRLYQEVKAIRGCTDPNATNYTPGATVDDGSCVFPTAEEKAAAQQLGVGGYFKSAVQRVFDNNFKGDRGNEPKVPITPFTGDIVSQRDIQRLVEFEKVVKTTLEKANQK